MIKESYFKERKTIGFLGLLLPLLCWASCLLIPDKHPGWHDSLSITYHYSPVLSMTLAVVSVFLFSYEGYDKWDRLVNRISSLAALTVAIVPCPAEWIEGNIGIFQLPQEKSQLIHYTAAGLLFLSFMVNIAFNFTKGQETTRNKLYYTIAALMFLVSIPFIVSCLTSGWFVTFWYETIELILFGTAWLIKGRFLQDED